ncbi:MAG TPA: hypothetical protein VKR38_01545 [Usitatibacter sp.]|nr:hypothetical protein [Usitatibacter sp.]
MATIVLLEHQMQGRLGLPYMAHELAKRWQERGHRVHFHRGVSTPPPGDVAIAHLDVTVVPDSYRALERHYPRVINSRTWDIRKSAYSTVRVLRDDAWPGKVIIKSDANHAGHVDDALRRLALAEGIATDIPERPLLDSYYLCDSIGKVPPRIWETPGVIVEKFVPETGANGNYIRIWTFLGSRERNMLYCSDDLMIRVGNFKSRAAVEVPPEMRAWREKLGFEFGKFDYVRHEGEYILLDANRTPGAPTDFTGNTEIVEAWDRLSLGIEEFLP